MPRFLARILEQFQTWLADSSSFLVSWYKKKERDIHPAKQLEQELPSALRAKLTKATKNLPNNQSNIQAISSALDSAFEEWMTSPQGTNNSIVILSSPVTPVALILSASIEQWAKQKNASMRLLPWKGRPHDFEDVASKLEHCLESSSNNPENIEIVVIPNLCWCFLRSLDGLEGIDYLQSLFLKDSTPENVDCHRFWIIGAEQTAWKYLDYVCNLKAYCGQSFVLPELTGEDLKQWLEPVVSELSIQFRQPNLDREEEEDRDIETEYFNKLASISQGISVVALEAFVQSISYQAPEQETENEENSDNSSEEAEKLLIAKNPTLPQLPFLESNDRYILYSLLIHQDLTLSALAESLGDEVAEVQAHIQVLRRKGIIKQEKEILQINPLYYPRLKQELANNNFIIEE